MTAVGYHRHFEDAEQFLDELVDLYAEVFAEPPYNEGPDHVRRFRGWLTGEFDTPGFTLIRATVGDTLIGMAYGYQMPAGEWWRDAIEDPPDGVRKALKFAVMEWAVRGEYRGRGVGRRLMFDLLHGRAEQYATLNVNPAAPARNIYRRLGWQPCGSTNPKYMPPMDILVRRLG